MTKEQLKRIHLIYGILVSAVIIIAGICFIVSCVGIYNSGDEPYSREIVAAAFSRIAVPVYLCLALVIGGFILNLAFPSDKEKLRAVSSDSLSLARLYRRTALDRCDEALRRSIAKENRSRKLHLLISAALLVIGCVLFLTYALNFEHFHPTEMNASMISAMKLLIPCLAIPFGYIVFTAYFNRNSIRRELDLVRQANAGGAKKETAHDDCDAQQTTVKREKFVFAVRCAILMIGLGLAILGIVTGGMADVLAKAINICTECIGLG